MTQPGHLAGQGAPCFVLLGQLSELLSTILQTNWGSERKSVSLLQFLKNLSNFTGKFRTLDK